MTTEIFTNTQKIHVQYIPTECSFQLRVKNTYTNIQNHSQIPAELRISIKTLTNTHNKIHTHTCRNTPHKNT